jgi:hypothetical protein
LLRLRAGSRPVHTKEGSDPAKMIAASSRDLLTTGTFKLPANDLSDVSSR